MLEIFETVVRTSLLFGLVESDRISSPIDLSHPLNSDTLNWTPEEKFLLKDQVLIDEPPSFYATNSLATPEHCGTHLDAPYHFNKHGWKVDEIPLSRLICPGVYVNVGDKVGENGDFELLPEHLEEWEGKNGRIPEGVILLADFGWSKRYGDRVAYYGNITAPYKFPGISVAAAKWMVSHRGIYGVGLDTPSIDPGYSGTFPAHETLLKANMFGLENIRLDGIRLPSKGFRIVALPMKITGGTGSPCRVVVDWL